MKICQVIPFFMPSAGFGGSVSHVFNVSKYLVKAGYAVTVCTSDMYTPNTRLMAIGANQLDGVEIRRFPTKLQPASNYFITPSIGRGIAEVRPDIIHAHLYRNFQTDISYIVSKMKKIPMVITAHGSIRDFRGQWKTRIYDSVFRFAQIRHAKRLIAVSKKEIEEYLSVGGEGYKIKVIPDAIDPNDFVKLPASNEFRSKLGIDSKEKIVLYVGRITERKGLQYLIPAFKKVMRKVAAKLVIVGMDDGYLKHVTSQVIRLDLSKKVFFTGILSEAEVLAAYLAADVVVLPARNEIFDITVLEASMCEKPVVTTNECGASDVVFYSGNGYVVRYGNIDSLADKITRILNLPQTAKSEMGKRGRQLVLEKYSWKKIVNDYIELYKEVIQK